MEIYRFKKTDKGYIGKAFEMALKNALKRSHADKVSPCGRADFRWHYKNYDAKQNGTCIRYNPNWGYVRGSNRVIYATHVSFSVVEENETEIAISINLHDTEMYVVDKKEFIEFLESINAVKYNSSRGTVNVQTCYNYTKNAYHGKKGILIEKWMKENEIETEILDAILG